jgi:hypothetical protein
MRTAETGSEKKVSQGGQNREEHQCTCWGCRVWGGEGRPLQEEVWQVQPTWPCRGSYEKRKRPAAEGSMGSRSLSFPWMMGTLGPLLIPQPRDGQHLPL